MDLKYIINNLDKAKEFQKNRYKNESIIDEINEIGRAHV